MGSSESMGGYTDTLITMKQGELNFENTELTDFERYDQDHPQVWRSFENFTMDAIRKGFGNYGARSIFELIRWHTGVNAEFPDGYKVNNTFTPHYARKFMQQHPEHDGYFRIRVQAKSNNHES